MLGARIQEGGGEGGGRREKKERNILMLVMTVIPKQSIDDNRNILVNPYPSEKSKQKAQTKKKQVKEF